MLKKLQLIGLLLGLCIRVLCSDFDPGNQTAVWSKIFQVYLHSVCGAVSKRTGHTVYIQREQITIQPMIVTILYAKRYWLEYKKE